MRGQCIEHCAGCGELIAGSKCCYLSFAQILLYQLYQRQARRVEQVGVVVVDGRPFAVRHCCCVHDLQVWRIVSSCRGERVIDRSDDGGNLDPRIARETITTVNTCTLQNNRFYSRPRDTFRSVSTYQWLIVGVHTNTRTGIVVVETVADT